AAADTKQSAEEKAKNEKELADAKAAAKGAREAFEAEQAKQHAAGGAKSLAEQAKALFGKLPQLPGISAALQAALDTIGEGGDLGEGLAGVKTSVFGTFNPFAAQGLGGGGDV